MKIAILVSMFFPKQVGGVEIATQNIAGHLAELRNNVSIITSLDKGLSKEGQEDKFFVHRVSYPKIKVLGVVLFWFKCLFLLKKINPEVAHSQTIQMGLPCFFAKIMFNIPYIVYCHGSDVYLDWKFKKIISKLVLKNADTVIVLTKDMKEKVESFGFDIKNISVIPNGIDLEKFKNLSKTQSRNDLKIDQSEKIILFAGTLKAVKGIKYLIEAISIAKEKGLKTKLILAGEGEEKKELEKMSEELNLKDNIIFIGRIDNDKIFKYMSASDILVLPSLSEGLPVVILEAMASGLPIIATRVGGVPEIIEDEKNGFLTDPQNSEQIADKILYLFSNENIRKSILANNLKEAEKYSWDLITKKITEVYHTCKK